MEQTYITPSAVRVSPNKRIKLRNSCGSRPPRRRRCIQPARLARANGNSSTHNARLAAPEVSPPQE
jgi:hypothetical protein